ncbi:YeiH family protein [Adlercreutzia shanghongiae]|uniref:YeiH family protein n=1 Tax=Adlercreutzia shanghongiae TaxID=3111773 RepID=A0ABU6J0T3_9ACTN|nr:YeiH family protein [Adlercreutzia sp. R22]MEC4295712.1 YeiH family protein [Adlercreutzia sp. R22]
MNAKTIAPGIGICAAIAIPCWFMGEALPVVGAPVFAILLGMLIALWWRQPARGTVQDGIAFTAKKILQYAVILLGFGLNLAQIAAVGAESLPIICSTIATALIVGYILYKVLHMDSAIATLIAVGSSICGGSAIAATAPVIHAKDEEVAQSISVIFLFNVLAALIFPTLGSMLGMSNEGFGLFAGTAVNDTSSVTAAAAAWDGMHPGANALDDATIVKLTRTLAIIPITLVLAILVARREQAANAPASAASAASADNAPASAPLAANAPASAPNDAACAANAPVSATQASAPASSPTRGEGMLGAFSLKRAFPMFILFFLAASVITTVAVALGADIAVFAPLKTASKFFICMAMAAIGLNTDIVKLVKSGGKPILMGAICWICIAAVSLGIQRILNLW